jgi:hypothetical protein
LALALGVGLANFTSSHCHQLASQGWVQLPVSTELEAWQNHALPLALQCMQARDLQHWWRYQKTWFVGVNALSNDSTGALDTGPSLPTGLLKQLTDYVACTRLDLDQAQVSACMPGYPKASPNEPTTSFAFRNTYFAAHMDGLHTLGLQRRRHLIEQHSFILGIPLSKHLPEAGPVMVWPGSHKLVQAWLQSELGHLPAEQWQDVDLTASYQTMRQQVLASMQPVPIHAPLGGAYLIHRHAIHGQGHWPENIANVGDNGRIIAYFRPCLHTAQNWLRS